MKLHGDCLEVMREQAGFHTDLDSKEEGSVRVSTVERPWLH